jgi:anti-anti-sigma factor
MEIKYKGNSENKSLLIKITGDCDMYSAKEFFIAVTDKMKDGLSCIFLDFSEVIYLDSSGVGAIIKIIKYSQEKKINLKFRGLTGTPRKVLRMSNILSLITEVPL